MSINKWQVYCNTENTWVSGWVSSESENPCCCFNNNSHNINTDSPQIIDSTAVITVKIEQEYIPTGGHFACQGFSMTIPANTTTILPVSWPFPVTTSIVNVQEIEENAGDILEAIVNPRTVVGTTTSVTLNGTKTCTVNSTVINNAQIGYEFYIGVVHLGRVLAIDKTNFIITFETTTTQEHPLGSPVYLELKIIRNYQLGTKVGSSLGAGNIGGKYLPKNTITNVIYTNNSNIEKKFRFSVEYLF
jgi:hypothetical protein